MDLQEGEISHVSVLLSMVKSITISNSCYGILYSGEVDPPPPPPPGGGPPLGLGGVARSTIDVGVARVSSHRRNGRRRRG